MLYRIVCLLAVAAAHSLNAAQVNYTNLVPQYGQGTLVKTDASGNVYLAGSYQQGFNSVFVEKIPKGATTPAYTTSVGGAVGPMHFLRLQAMAIAPDGSVYLLLNADNFILGSTFSITKLDPDGNIVPNVPGSNAPPLYFDYIQDLATDGSGNVYITGIPGAAFSSPGALNNPRNPGFTYKLDPTLSTLIWAVSGYSGTHIAVDANQNVYLLGSTTTSVPISAGAFQTGYTSVGSSISPGSACAGGPGPGPDLTLICSHQYVTAIDKSGARLIYSTYLSGSYDDSPSGITVDASGNAYIAGSTHSFDFPVTPGSLQTTFPAQAPNTQFGNFTANNAVSATGYVAVLNPSGTNLIFSTFVGGSATDLVTSIALDPANQLIELGGNANSPDFPGVEGAYRHCTPQSFIARLTMDGTAVRRTVLLPVLASFTVTQNNTAFFTSGAQTGTIDFEAPDSAIACIANSADLTISNTAAPGQLLTVFGNQFGPAAQTVPPVNGSQPTVYNGVQVTVAGMPAPLLYVSPDQVNLQVPFDITSGLLQFSATNVQGAAVSDSSNLYIPFSNVSVLEVPIQSGECQGSYLGQMKTFVINADGTLNSCSNPAALGSIVTIFIDGLGMIPGQSVTGLLNAPGLSPLNPLPSLTAVNSYDIPPTVISATPFSGAISGFYQVQLQLPNTSMTSVLQANLGNYYSNDLISIQVVP